MKKIEVKIALDPVNDGAGIKDINLIRKNEGALIIGTNGESRIADALETNSILDRLSEVGHGEYLGKSDYIAMFNGDKIINFGTGRCFIGSVIILKYAHEKLSLLRRRRIPKLLRRRHLKQKRSLRKSGDLSLLMGT